MPCQPDDLPADALSLSQLLAQTQKYTRFSNWRYSTPWPHRKPTNYINSTIFTWKWKWKWKSFFLSFTLFTGDVAPCCVLYLNLWHTMNDCVCVCVLSPFVGICATHYCHLYTVAGCRLSLSGFAPWQNPIEWFILETHTQDDPVQMFWQFDCFRLLHYFLVPLCAVFASN